MNAGDDLTDPPTESVRGSSSPRWQVLLRIPQLPPASASLAWGGTEATPDEGEGQASPEDLFTETRWLDKPGAAKSPSMFPPFKDKTVSLLARFKGKQRHLGTIGTMVAVVLVCTFVARAMKQDHGQDAFVESMARRDAPAIESETLDIAPSEAQAVTPDFDPAVLAAGLPQANASTMRTPQVESFEQQPFPDDLVVVPPVATAQDNWWDQAVAKSSAMGNANEVSRRQTPLDWNDPRGAGAAAATFNSNPVTVDVPSVDTFRLPSQPAVAAEVVDLSGAAGEPSYSNAPGPAHVPESTPSHRDLSPEATPVETTDIWPPLGQQMPTSRQGDDRFIAANPPAAGKAAGVSQVTSDLVEQSSRYPSTSRTTYPSLEEWEALLAQRAARDRLKLGALRGQSGKPNSNPSSGIVR